MQLTEMLKYLQDVKKLTQTEIAKFAKVNQSTISRVLNGKSTDYESGKRIEQLYINHRYHPPKETP